MTLVSNLVANVLPIAAVAVSMAARKSRIHLLRFKANEAVDIGQASMRLKGAANSHSATLMSDGRISTEVDANLFSSGLRVRHVLCEQDIDRWSICGWEVMDR